MRRSRRSRRQKEYDSDPDYEGEKSERSGGRHSRNRGAKRSTASTGAARPAHLQQSYGAQQYQAQQRRQVSGTRPCLGPLPSLHQCLPDMLIPSLRMQ